MSFSKFSALAGVLSLISSVAAHGHVRGISVAGQWVGGWELAYAYTNTPPDVIGWSTTALDNGFVEPAKFKTSDIACHLGGKAGKAFATVAAGSKVEVFWDTWPESHRGPVLDYLAPFNEDPASLSFFKFAEAGLIDGSAAPGKWASDQLIANNNSWTVTIPDVAPGKYVWRHEIIALHGAGSENGAQNYPQCLNLEITGSGTSVPAGIPATQFYTPQDPGILVSIYQALASYVIPGPAVSDGGSAPAPQPSAPAPAPSASAPATPTETPSTEPEYPTTAAPTAAPTLPPYSNYTLPATSKTKSACKPKPTSAAPALTPVATESGPQPTVTVVPTPETPAPETPSPSPETPSPETPAPSPEVPTDSSLPAGTKLSTVLSWLATFYQKHGAGEYTSETALRRRHARQF